MIDEKVITKLSPQTKRVLKYMAGGQKLTNLIAMTNLQVGSLSSRISELLAAGFKISKQWSQDHWKRTYLRYYMEPDEAAKVSVESL